MNKNYREDMKDDIKEKKKACSQIEIDCGVCGCKVRKCRWNRHVKTKKHIWAWIVKIIVWGIATARWDER